MSRFSAERSSFLRNNRRDLLVLCALAVASVSSQAQQSHLYYFNESPYMSTTGTGPVMVPIGEVTTPVTVTIPATTCPDEPVIDVTHFTYNSGFAAKAFFTHTYSVEVIFQFDEMSGYNRIIDFSNSNSDNGIYIYNTCLNFYPIGSIGECPDAFDPVNYKQLVITRDGSSQTMNVYLNGELFTTHVDVDDHYVIGAAPEDSIKFFRDDDMIGNEASSGHVVLIRMADVAMSQDEVEESFANFCTNILAGVDEVQPELLLNVWPNPASGSLSIELPDQGIDRIEMLDLRGKSVGLWSTDAVAQNLTIPLHDIAAGVYVLRASRTGQVPLTRRIVVDH
jgi:hypothetical protein